MEGRKEKEGWMERKKGGRKGEREAGRKEVKMEVRKERREVEKGGRK